VALGGFVSHGSTDVNGTLVASLGPLTSARFQSLSDEVTGVGDLFPQAYLKWNSGVHSVMIYGMGAVWDWHPLESAAFARRTP
jgi:hypothetical protein